MQCLRFKVNAQNTEKRQIVLRGLNHKLHCILKHKLHGMAGFFKTVVEIAKIPMLRT